MKYDYFAANARKNLGVVSNSRVYFTSNVPNNTVVGGPEPLKLKKILDLVCLPICLLSFGYLSMQGSFLVCSGLPFCPKSIYSMLSNSYKFPQNLE